MVQQAGSAVHSAVGLLPKKWREHTVTPQGKPGDREGQGFILCGQELCMGLRA